MEMTGLIAQTIEDLRSEPEMRRLRQEVDEAIAEFKGARAEVRRALEAAAPEILERAGYRTIRKELLQRMRRLRAQVREACIQRSPMTAGVWGIAGESIVNRAFMPRLPSSVYSSYLYLKI